MKRRKALADHVEVYVLYNLPSEDFYKFNINTNPNKSILSILHIYFNQENAMILDTPPTFSVTFKSSVQIS